MSLLTHPRIPISSPRLEISRIVLLAVSLAAAFQVSPAGADPPAGWRQHDTKRPRPPVVTTSGQDGPLSAPSDAVTLFDGTDLSKWQAPGGAPTKWEVDKEDGSMFPAPGAGMIETKEKFGDIQLHLEWRTPTKIKGTGQGRGNSGVWFMSRYELQILDSFENETYADGQAAAIYGQDPPLVNATRPPGVWQTYDVVFRAPIFGPDGRVRRPALLTAFHNGVLVQDRCPINGRTNWLRILPYEKHNAKEPLGLQDHGDPVCFRNIWVRELAPQESLEDEQATDREVVPKYELPESELERFVGTYDVKDMGAIRITRKKDWLFAHFFNLDFPLRPTGPNILESVTTDLGFRFSEDRTQLTFVRMGEELPGTRMK